MQRRDTYNSTEKRARRSRTSPYNVARGTVRDTGSIRDAGRNERQGALEPQGSVQQRTYTPSKRVNPVRKLINDWFDRLLGAVSDGGLNNQEEEYASGRTCFPC